MSFLQQQLANVAWTKEQLLKEGYTPEVQEEAFQEDLFFPKSTSELSSALGAVDAQFENKQFDEAKAATLKALLKRALTLYNNAAKELRKDRIAKEKADKAAAEALAKQAQGEKPVVETENVKVKGNWWKKNKWFVIGGLALLATTITVIAVVRSKKK
jgi:maltodextrin utilization protein YvdJ